DLDRAVPKIVRGAYAYAGQVCISVQRVLVHRSVARELRERLEAAVLALRLGDPLDESSDLSAMIDEAAAERVDDWIDEALEKGAAASVRGVREGNRLPPAIVVEPPPEVRLAREEVFGPVLALWAYDDFDEALARVDASRYGLQAGLFTRDVERSLRAWERL